MSDIVACVQCGAKNRLKTSPQGGKPTCGRCGEDLPWLTTGDDSTFAQDLSAPVPVLVDFWAPWCGPCRIVAPVLEEMARERRGHLKVVKLNIDENQTTAGQFQVQSIPTLILLKDGQPVETVVGALPKHALKARLAGHL